MSKDFVTAGWIANGRAVFEPDCLTVLEADLFSDRVKRLAYADIQRVCAGTVFPPVPNIIAYMGLFVVGLLLAQILPWFGLPIAVVGVAILVVEFSRRRTIVIIFCGGYPTKLKKDRMTPPERTEFINELLRRVARAQAPRREGGA